MLSVLSLITGFLAAVTVTSLESCKIVKYDKFEQLTAQSYMKRSKPLKSTFIADFQYANWSLLRLDNSYYVPLLDDCSNPQWPRKDEQAPTGTLYMLSPEFYRMFNKFSCEARSISLNIYLDYKPGLNFYKDDGGSYMSIVLSRDMDEYIRHKYNSFRLGNLHSAFAEKHFCLSLKAERMRTTGTEGDMVDYSLISYFDFTGIDLVNIKTKAIELAAKGNATHIRKLFNRIYSYWLALGKRKVEFYPRAKTVFVNNKSFAVYTTVMNFIEALDISQFSRVLTDYFMVLDYPANLQLKIKAAEVADRYNKFIGCFYTMNKDVTRSFTHAMNDSREWQDFAAMTADYILAESAGESPGGALDTFAEALKGLDEYTATCYKPNTLKSTKKTSVTATVHAESKEDIELIGDYLTRKLPKSIAELNGAGIMNAAVVILAHTLLAGRIN